MIPTWLHGKKEVGTNNPGKLRLNAEGIHLLPGRHIHLRHHTGNQAATGSQLGAGIRGKHHPGLNSNFSSLFRVVMSLA